MPQVVPRLPCIAYLPPGGFMILTSVKLTLDSNIPRKWPYPYALWDRSDLFLVFHKIDPCATISPREISPFLWDATSPGFTSRCYLSLRLMISPWNLSLPAKQTLTRPCRSPHFFLMTLSLAFIMNTQGSHSVCLVAINLPHSSIGILSRSDLRL